MRALALVEAPDHVCCRYRVRAFEPAVAAAGATLTIHGIEKGLPSRLRQLTRAGDHDVVLLQRKLLPGWQFHLLRRSAQRLVFDFDDAVLYRDSYDPRGPHCRRRADRFARTVREADLVLAGNDFLAGCARDAGAEPGRVRVLPTCVDTEKLRPDPTHRPPSRGLDLVWIGSSSTLQGLELQRPVLERIGREVADVRLRLICDRFPRFDPLEVVPIPWRDATEAHDLAASDAGLSWVPDDLWSRGKCGLKLLQYRACGLPTIANPVGVHPRIVRHGADGLLAVTPDEWVEAVRLLSRDASLRARMGQAARAATESEYSLAAWSGAFVAALAGGTEPGAPRGAEGCRSRTSDLLISDHRR
jgi:glycosyltransferase involved in cell wall biosynthesis